MSKDKKKATLKENVVSIILAIFLVMVIRSTFFEPYKIPSGSMVPTLLVGDHIFVKKFAYGWKVPFTEFFMEEPMYLGGKSLPERGDIIVFKYPRDPSIYYIKRVVGIPGDKIEVIDKKIYINGKPVEANELPTEERKNVSELVDPNDYDVASMRFFRENHANASPIVIHDENSFTTTHFGPTEVPENSVFTMGDNRDHSSDSRFWGFAPTKYVKGKAVVIWWSIWLGFKEDKYFFRPSRIGKLLD